MTPEQKQRLDLIREKVAASPRNYHPDFHFLLSLVESAGSVTPFCPVHKELEKRDGLVLEVGNDCVACSLHERTMILNMLEPFAAADGSQDSLTVLQRVIDGEPMRSRCVEKVKTLRDSWKSEGSQYEEDFDWRVDTADKLITALESVSIQEQKK